MVKVNTNKGNFSRTFTRRDFLSTSLKTGAAAFTTGLLPNLKAKASGQYNVLFIIVDDLRPLLGCYGHTEMHTPNIDALANRGTLFNRAYCQYPLCNPSRTSILTGLRPHTNGVIDNAIDYRDKIPNAVILPQQFKDHGYYTQAIGRVLHIHELQNDQRAWSARSWGPAWTSIDRASTPSWNAIDAADDELRDGRTAEKVAEVLAQVQNHPFFLAVGFYKPHLPYNAPQQYFDLYDSKTFNIHTDATTPENVPRIARTNWNEIRAYEDVPDGNTPISQEKILELTRAYAASVSYTDALVGRILEQLEALNLTDNTVVVLVGDHGYHLGEHGTWGKNTLFEVSARSPLIISMPEQTQPSTKTDALVELVDIYPTLCDACQLPIPSQLEGISLLPVIAQLTQPWKTATFSELKRSSFLGNSIRTAQYRYTEWGDNGQRGKELYDYYADPDETVNIANLPENIELVEQLSEQLSAGWQKALPDVSGTTSTPKTLPWDINNDGIVDVQDLLLVSNSFGMETPEHPKADINKDGNVDIIDLLYVASHFGESCIASAPPASVSQEHFDSISEWLTEAYQVDDGSDVLRHGIANLEALFNTVTPKKTILLPNFPNPFNPETWIPYDLGTDANVIINIYNLKGETIKEINMGYQDAGTYRRKEKAAYWDGCNSEGELVASGVYFYSLNTGTVKAIRRMTILK